MAKINDKIIENIKRNLNVDDEINTNVFVLFELLLNHMSYKANEDWINSDKLIVSSKYKPLLDEMNIFFGKKADVESSAIGDVLGTATGVAIGERYLTNLSKQNNPKLDLINFNTFCLCDWEDLLSGTAYEALSFAGFQKLNKLVVLCQINETEGKKCSIENLIDRFIGIDFEIIEIKNTLSSSTLAKALSDALNVKKPTIITYKTRKSKKKEETEEIDLEEAKEYIGKITDKRLNKKITKWEETKKSVLNDPLINEIIKLLESKKTIAEFQSSNFKLGDNYNESLNLSSQKIFNLLAKKSKFILNIFNDINDGYKINNSETMSKENPLGRNIYVGSRYNSIGYIANGLASLGFKVFLSSKLTNSTFFLPAIKQSINYKYPVTYIFNGSSEDMDIFRNIPNLITFRPADINEIVGTYEIVNNLEHSTVVFVNDEIIKKIALTNPRYVLAGAYRVLKESENFHGTIIATGSEVLLGLEVANALSSYGVNLRVVSMPSKKLFYRQSEKYRNSLIPRNLPVFVIEFSNTDWREFAKDENVFTDKNTNTKENIQEKIIESLKKEMNRHE